jgi:hypothetical protein
MQVSHTPLFGGTRTVLWPYVNILFTLSNIHGWQVTWAAGTMVSGELPGRCTAIFVVTERDITGTNQYNTNTKTVFFIESERGGSSRKTQFFSVGWDYNSELWPPTNLLFFPPDIWEWRPWWNDTDRGKPKKSMKICPSATLSTSNPAWNDPGANPGLRGWRPAMAQPKTQFNYHFSKKHVSFPHPWGRLPFRKVTNDIKSR